MDISSSHWLPLTEYALRSGMSISTLRRKIKSNSIAFKMEDGRYLIKSDDLAEAASVTGFASTDLAPRVPATRPGVAPVTPPPAPSFTLPPVAETRPQPPSTPLALPATGTSEIALLREEIRRMQEDSFLRWRALEARVSGIAKKLEMFSEQMAETKMLVKLFEEKLDNRA